MKKDWKNKEREKVKVKKKEKLEEKYIYENKQL